MEVRYQLLLRDSRKVVSLSFLILDLQIQLEE